YVPIPAVSSPGGFRTTAPVSDAPSVTGRHPKPFTEADEAKRKFKACGAVAYARRSGSFIRQQTPPGSKARSTVPPSSCEISSSIRLVPNPACVGLATGGPPVSHHSTVKAPALSPGGVSQLIDTRPPALDSAPNFTALVASSWTTIASAWVVAAASRMFGPWVVTFVPVA